MGGGGGGGENIGLHAWCSSSLFLFCIKKDPTRHTHGKDEHYKKFICTNKNSSTAKVSGGGFIVMPIVKIEICRV